MTDRHSLGACTRWEAWPGAVYVYLECWDDVDSRTVQWRRDASGNVEVFV